jgi:two-component system sensor histidine kinase KdpD
MAIDNRIFLETESLARARAEADKEQALKSLAFVSHELRTPLTSIKGFASTLLADDVTWSPEQQRDFIETINDEANKLNGFIDQLLDMSKMDAGVFNFSISRHSVNNMVMMIMTRLQTLSEQHNLSIHIPQQLPEVLTDVQCFEQVLTNLVENAAKYAPAGTEIHISAQPIKGFVEFIVADEGPGIPVSEREKVFQPFYRTGDKAIQKAKGAGLGLTICRRLIEGQGGQIWVDGQADVGAVIHFTLPLAENTKK